MYKTKRRIKNTIFIVFMVIAVLLTVGCSSKEENEDIPEQVEYGIGEKYTPEAIGFRLEIFEEDIYEYYVFAEASWEDFDDDEIDADYYYKKYMTTNIGKYEGTSSECKLVGYGKELLLFYDSIETSTNPNTDYVLYDYSTETARRLFISRNTKSLFSSYGYMSIYIENNDINEVVIGIDREHGMMLYRVKNGSYLYRRDAIAGFVSKEEAIVIGLDTVYIVDVNGKIINEYSIMHESFKREIIVIDMLDLISDDEILFYVETYDDDLYSDYFVLNLKDEKKSFIYKKTNEDVQSKIQGIRFAVLTGDNSKFIVKSIFEIYANDWIVYMMQSLIF